MSAPAAPALPPAVQAKCDPYLLSALLSQFAHYDDHADGGSAPLLSVGFTVVLPSAGLTAASVQATLADWVAAHPGARITDAHLNPLAHGARTAYVTADVSPTVLLLLGAAPFVTELQLCANPLPRRPLAARPTTPASPPAAPLRTANKKILATIDHGCAFAHQMLQNAGGTRVWALWDQDPRPDFDPAQGSTPIGYGYGRQVGRDVLNACVAPNPPVPGWNEDRCYAQARYGAVQSRLTHGMWVTGLLGSAMTSPSLTESGHAKPCHDAEDADLIFVQLPRAIPLAPGLGSIDRAVLDGLRYIADCAPDDAEIALVIDYGTDMGPHDGTSWFERALDALTAELLASRNVQLNAFYAAGNAHDARRHAVIWGEAAKVQSAAKLPWWLPMDNAAPVAMELWFHEAAPACELRLQAPGASAPLTIHLANDWLGTPPGMQPGQCVVVSKRMRGRPGQAWQRQVLIDVGPTQRPDNASGTPAAPAGVWTLTLTPTGSTLLQPVHAYTCWGGQNPGVPQRAQATRFVTPPEDMPQAGAVRVTGSGSVLGSGCGDSNQVWMVGGYERWGQRLRARYASGGGVRGGKRAAPLGVPPHQGVDWLAATEQSSALPGLLLLGTRSASRSRGRGTSFAAPQAARQWLAGTLTTDPPPTHTRPGPASVQWPRDEYGEPRIAPSPD
ncbi:MAG: hypothetical protein IPG98_01945 [Burkholderiales bacterium]|nr:hypothetical protein [Burkholderiales bacterium]MBK8667605.1 hypothetical protein [Burkholderiales bacterium]